MASHADSAADVATGDRIRGLDDDARRRGSRRQLSSRHGECCESATDAQTSWINPRRVRVELVPRRANSVIRSDRCAELW